MTCVPLDRQLASKCLAHCWIHENQLVLVCLVRPSHAPVKNQGQMQQRSIWANGTCNQGMRLPCSRLLHLPWGHCGVPSCKWPCQNHGKTPGTWEPPPSTTRPPGLAKGPRGLGLALGKHPEAGNTQRGDKQMPALLRRFRVNECTIHSKHMVYPNL